MKINKKIFAGILISIIIAGLIYIAYLNNSTEAELLAIKRQMDALERKMAVDGKLLGKLLERIEHTQLLYDDVESYTKVRNQYLALQKTVAGEYSQYALLLDRYTDKLREVNK